jgi:acyl-CoA-dependent ceramide synthase
MLKYVGCQQACDAAFALFVVTWFIARHVGYMSICWSIYAHVATVTMPYGTYSTFNSVRLSTDGGHKMLDNLLQPLLYPSAKTVSFNPEIRNMFLGLLGGLQVITIAWFVMIIRVVAKVLQGHPADDSRSDDEGEEEEEEEIEYDDEMQISSTHHEVGVPYKLRADAQATATAGAERKFIEVTASSEDLKFTSSNSSKTGSKRKGKGGISSGLHLGEHKDIGCLSDEQLAREKELRAGKSDARRK